MIAHHTHYDKQTEQRYAQRAYDTKHTEHNDLDTILLCLYNESRFLR